MRLPSGGQLRQWRRAWEAVFALVGCVALLALVFSAPAEDFCVGHRVGCGLVTGFISTSLILLAGYIILFSWTLRRARRSYLDVARRSPERFFVVPPRLRAKAVGREDLTGAVARETAFSRTGVPVVVVGEAGAGKTTFLQELIRLLAQLGSVPVLVPLRGAPTPVDLRELAQKEFLRRIDPLVRSQTDAERVWRRLLAEGSVVVLADGLDEIAPSATRQERDYAIRSALATARNDRLSVVITSRPDAVPAGAAISQFELGDIEEDEALGYLRASIHLRSEGGEKRLREIVSVGRVTRIPFYLNVISSLYRAERLDHVRGSTRDELLVALLDEWTDLVEDESFLEGAELEEDRRKAIIHELEAVAYAMTLASAPDSTLERVMTVLGETDGDGAPERAELELVVEGAARLDLIRAFSGEDDTTIRFNHAISQAYMTSRFLRRAPGAWRALVERTASAEMRDALLMWCAAGEGKGEASDVCKALVHRATSLRDDRALALLVSAAEISSCVGLGEFDRIAGDGVRDVWLAASPRAKVAAVRRLDGRTDAWSFRRLHAATRDRSYRVRWGAALSIVDGGASAAKALWPTFDDLLAYGESQDASAWGKEQMHDLSVLGWILPALSARAGGDGAVDEGVARFVELARRGLPLGTDASLAQGFKLAAALDPKASVLSAAYDLVDHCRFWYARVILLQAICTASVGDPARRETGLAFLARRRNDADEHPFVRESALLCHKAIRRPADASRYVWEDESAVIARSGAGLAGDAAALLADLVVLLNLTEQGEGAVRSQRKEDTYARRDLPYCLSASTDRSELFEGCHETCAFNLCPYPTGGERALARGEFSQAFCRRQIDGLTGLSGVQWWTPTRRAWSWSNAGRAALADFWAELERRAS
jgi:NACHT domain